MSNPWAKSFEDLRAPYLQEKKAKKDYDGDGKVESGAKEYRGVVHNKIQKAKGGKADGQDTSSVKEHHQKDADGNVVEHGDGTPASLDEISNRTMRNYIIKGTKDVAKRASDPESHSGPKYGKKMKRIDGVSKAADKLAKKASSDARMKEEVEQEEISYTAAYLPSNVDEAKVDKRLPSGPFAGGAKDRSQARNLRKFGKKEGGDVPDKKGSHKYNPMASFEKRGNTEKLSKERRKEHEAKRGVKKEEVVIEADKKGSGSGKKDACYKKVKASASVWPSAYASGRLVQCRKKGAANYGNSKKEEFDFRIKSFDDMVGECWKTHKQVGTKMKGGKVVPNCVPKNEEVFIEALKGKKLDIDDSGKVNNKIEINPEVKSEEAKAPVKK